MLEMSLILIKCLIILTPLGIWLVQKTFKYIHMNLEPISSFEVHNFRDCILLIAEIVKGIKLSLCYITETNLYKQNHHYLC